VFRRQVRYDGLIRSRSSAADGSAAAAAPVAERK
jgi:hypothetical protein